MVEVIYFDHGPAPFIRVFSKSDNR
jgi:hypothetical protein